MDEELQQTLSVNVDGIEEIDRLNESLSLSPQRIERMYASFNRDEALIKVRNEIEETKTYLDNLEKTRAIVMSSNDENKTSWLKDVDSDIKMYRSNLSNLERAEQSLAGDSDDDSDSNTGLSIVKIANQMAPVASELSEIAGISPKIVSNGGEIISSVMNATLSIGALIAVIKVVSELIKSRNEWDKMNARIEAFGGDSKEALSVANEVGIKYDREFAARYTELLGRTRGDVELVNSIVRQAKELESTGYTTLNEVLDAYNMAHRTGSLGSLADLSYMSAWEKERSTMGREATFKYSNSNLNMAYGYTQGSVIRDWNSRIKDGDITTLSKEIRSIDTLNESINTFSNKITGNWATGSIFGDNGTTNTFNSNKAIPVNVMNSIMLSNETIDILTDLREHQFTMQINLSHTTPMVSQNNTFNNGAEIDYNKLLGQITDSIQTSSESGSALYNDGEL